MEADREQLSDELEAIEAIYPEAITDKLPDSSIIHVKIPSHEYITVQISFPAAYPTEKPPNVLEVAVTRQTEMDLFEPKYLKNLFQEVMDSVFHQGEVCLFDFFVELDGILYVEDVDTSVQDLGTISMDQLIPDNPFEGWYASEPISDRGSTFMAFATHINSEEEAFQKFDIIKTDTKMRKANHIMSAWRIKVPGDNGKELIVQDCDDDGEAAAGSRMLHLVNIMDVWNVLVIVARWFGGTHIGPDRFKHINSTAREAILKAGFERKK
ncbi:Yih1p KNAG_0I02530 [Huiozyma naganishii CBS 8797]|uniref:RWD domain-containing protein n=1 Tax=Huiozyma naganishii (strain ATCC MYA-139 / BCRC 22969 / CBS 8797 / KCTC 17520 / NBRC 10181 / NCYC 3082 / Yp74L-3) TaxID=1071383 RepID=J7RQI3_HUIN7|nr:hypothetical protein KNAG_0I02530 [Kazachstania naganishii CBS 8797]CCK72038.1 hypothetical protein KNAG_0I02530 [Kazachstania naganishii CBS 8797]